VFESHGSAFVAVDVGQIVWAQITAEAMHELELRPGADAVCLIKTHSLKVIG
jgi:molybdopterin-binding protein